MKKSIIITGTSRGIGLELVKQFAEEGHNVLSLSRNHLSLEKSYPNVHHILFDLANEADFQKVTDFLKSWKKVDILINNAGNLIHKPFENLSMEDFQKVYQVNVFGVAKMIQIVLPYMEKGSNILNISSMGGVKGSMKFAGLTAYSSSKGAVITLTEVLAQEYEHTGIHFNTLALGAVQTEMLQQAFPDYQAKVQPYEMAQYVVNFTLHQSHLFNGKTIEVSNSTP